MGFPYVIFNFGNVGFSRPPPFFRKFFWRHSLFQTRAVYQRTYFKIFITSFQFITLFCPTFTIISSLCLEGPQVIITFHNVALILGGFPIYAQAVYFFLPQTYYIRKSKIRPSKYTKNRRPQYLWTAVFCLLENQKTIRLLLLSILL